MLHHPYRLATRSTEPVWRLLAEERSMKTHRAVISGLVMAGLLACPLASAGLAPVDGSTAATPTAHRRFALWLWWNAWQAGDKPRPGGLLRFLHGGPSLGGGPVGQAWNRPGQGEAATENDDDPPPDEDPLPPPNESQPDLVWLDSLGDPFGGLPPNDDTAGRPSHLPVPGAAILGALGLVMVHRLRRQ